MSPKKLKKCQNVLKTISLWHCLKIILKNGLYSGLYIFYRKQPLKFNIEAFSLLQIDVFSDSK